MESIVSYFALQGIDFWSLIKAGGILLLGALLISGLLRFIFGRKTLMGRAVSSSIAIIFIYLVMALITVLVPKLHWLLTPLPFATFSSDTISFLSLQGLPFTIVSEQLLSMIILAFLVNLLEIWLPKKGNILGWLFWKCVTVALGLLLHYLICWLFNKYLPTGIAAYAPVILLVILLVMLLTGALRFVVALILASVNPVIAGLYTFFFATLVGKQVTKAVLTTGILVGVVQLLHHFGVATLVLTSAALIAYIPFLLILVIVWYMVNRFL